MEKRISNQGKWKKKFRIRGHFDNLIFSPDQRARKRTSRFPRRRGKFKTPTSFFRNPASFFPPSSLLTPPPSLPQIPTTNLARDLIASSLSPSPSPMAPACDLPCDGDGVCMVCKAAVPEAEVLLCRTCSTPWHALCLARPPETLASVADWECHDCFLSAATSDAAPVAALSGASGNLIASIRAIEADTSLTEREKARRRQALVSRSAAPAVDEEEKEKKKKGEGEDDDVFDLFDEKFKCSF